MTLFEQIYLVDENPEAHGVFDSHNDTQKARYAEIKSVGYAEFYSAKSAGITPTIIFVLSDYSDYNGEKLIIWNSKPYRVVRTYMTGMKLEITVEEATNDCT